MVHCHREVGAGKMAVCASDRVEIAGLASSHGTPLLWFFILSYYVQLLNYPGYSKDHLSRTLKHFEISEKEY